MKRVINNDFYEDLKERWYSDCSHPVALLRKENEARNPWILDVIKKKLGNGKKILDIGCGGGFLTTSLAEAGHEVFGVDLSANSLKIAKEHDLTRTAHFLQANALQLPFEDQSFDVVCAMDVLEHVETPSYGVVEAARVLKNGGLFFFNTLNRNPLSWLIAIKAVEILMSTTPPNLHVYHLFIKPEELTYWCAANRIRVQEIRGIIPKFSWPFWKSCLKRSVDEKMSFRFSSSLKIGYVGFGKKQDDAEAT